MNLRTLAARICALGLLGLFTMSGICSGAAQNQAQPAPQTQPAAVNGITGTRGVVLAHSVMNFAELARKEKLNPPKHVIQKFVQHRRPPRHKSLPPGAVIKLSPALAPSVSGGPRVESATPPIPRSPDLAAGFLALLDDQNVIPPDTQGTVGASQLMVTLNSQVAVENKAGGQLSVVSLDGFWASVLGPPGPGIGTTDPRVVYDPFNDRWITSAAANPQSASAGVLVGVSQTSDATGRFNLYKVAVDNTNQHFCDFPILGFNNQWVVVMCNVFANNPNVNYFAGKIYVFNKATLYAGGNAVPTVIDTGGDSNVTPASTYDNNPATPEYLVEEFCGLSTACGGTSPAVGLMRLWQLTGAVNNPVLTSVGFPATSLTWDESGPTDFAPQAGGVGGIDTGAAQTTNVVYRNGHLWTAHTIFLPAGGFPNRSSVQWWELGPFGNVLQNGVIDTPNASVFRAYPSIAVNQFEDALVGYSRFTPSGYASAYYSFRGHADPSNVLQNEALLHPGQAPYFKTYGGASDRWGDYSNTAVDPADDTTLWTIQEYADFPDMFGSSTWGTWWGEVVPPGPPASFNVVPNTQSPTAWVPLTDLAVTVLDAAGHRVTGYQGTVHFTSSDPSANLPPDYTFVISDDGTHHFSGVTLFKSGTQSITVADVANPAIQGVANLDVLPVSLVMTPSVGMVTAGTSFNFTVTAEDASQNVVTGYGGTVQFASSDSTAVISPSSYTFVPGTDSGTHSFSATLYRAGVQRVFATDVTAGVQGSFNITVNPAAAKTLQLAAPATVTRGVAFNLVVTALDPFGNRATGYPGKIGFTSSDLLAVLPASAAAPYTFTGGDAGRHVFSVTLSTLGPQTVTATDTVTPTITGTASFTVANISGAMQQDIRVRLGTGLATQFIKPAVATFTLASPPGTLSATIDWGNGVINAGTITSAAGVFTVFGNPQYARPPEKPITVTVTDTANGTLVLTGNVRFWPKAESH